MSVLSPTQAASAAADDEPCSHSDGASESVAEVYEQQLGFVWRVLRRLGVREPALDDAVQDVFVVVHRRWGEFEGRSSVRTWVYGIAARVAKQYRRSARRRLHWFSPMDGLQPVASHSETPEQQLAHQQATRLLHQLLDQLSEDRRAIFVAAELEQVPVVDAAKAMGWNPNTAQARLRKARQQFDAALARHHARQKWRLR